MQFSASVIIAMAIAFAQPSLQSTCTGETDEYGNVAYTILRTPAAPDPNAACGNFASGIAQQCAIKREDGYNCGNTAAGQTFLLYIITKCSAHDVTNAWLSYFKGEGLTCPVKAYKGTTQTQKSAHSVTAVAKTVVAKKSDSRHSRR